MRQPLWLDERTALPYQINTLMIACLILWPWFSERPDGRTRPQGGTVRRLPPPSLLE